MSRIPVSIVSGFLGSGKTTLLNRLLRQPGMSDTAVIVNEFGEIGLDHELVEASDGSVVLLPNGCVCCAVRGSFVQALDDLHQRRARGAVTRFARVVVETSGLADPGPLIQVLLAEPSLRARYLFDTVTVTVDVVHGAATLDTHLEAVRQLAVADRIVLTKQDMLPEDTAEATVAELTRMLHQVNPGAMLGTASAAIDALARAAPFDPAQGGEIGPWLRDTAYRGRQACRHGRHRGRVRSFCVVRDEAIDEGALELFLSGLGKHLGPRLLRLKGIVHVAQRPDRPVVVQGVQTLLHEPVRLACWPGPVRRTRLVFITLDIEQDEIEDMLGLMERMQARALLARVRASGLPAQAAA